MEAHEPNTQKISEGRVEATSFAENPGASTVEGNGNTDCHSARDEEDLLPTQLMPDQVTDREGNAAQSRESSGDRQQLPQGPDDLEAAAPFPQEDVASSTAHSSRLDDAERRRLRYLLGSSLDNPAVLRNIERHLSRKIVAVSRRIAEEAAEIGVLTDRLREERARGDMLKALLTAARAGSRRLESELMASEREDQSESAHNLGGANDGDEDGAAYLRHDWMSPSLAK